MKVHIHKLIIVILLVINTFSHAQLENANWYFGGNTGSENPAGLSFNNSVTVLTDGQTDDNRFFTSVVSDENGSLLFYTDGRSVWNKNHVKMPNGNNTLNGIFHTVSIVPFPGDNNKYYVFTIKVDVFNENDDYYYSVVDMSLDNSLGDIVQSSINTSMGILPYVDPQFNIKNENQRKNNMVVAKHSDGESYWLILNPFDVFFILKIDSNGISSNPIIYNENIPYLDYSNNIQGSSGISISPNSDKISYFTRRIFSGDQGFEFTILNFNNTTGQLTPFYSDNNPWSFNVNNGYACEFSSDNRFIYLLDNNITSYNIYQFDTQNLNNSPIFIGSSLGGEAETDFPTLVRGIDDKIYVPNSNNFLGVINSPNLLGTSSNYVNNQINLGVNVIAKKLPQQVQVQSNNDCPDNLTITQTVSNGNTDIQEAASWIVASNIIENGANAEYDANKFVRLEVGFHANAGSYFRAYIDGCIPMSSKTTNERITNKEEIVKSIFVYPNPAKNLVNLSHNYLKIQSYTLYDIHGRKVKYQNEINNTKHSIDVSNFEEGIYILNITLEDNSTATKHLILN
jgi:hypothetical protein